MKRTLLLISASLALLASCQTPVTHIEDVSDLPVKTTVIPDREWEMSPLRAHALYVFYDARSSTEIENRKGDYFFVNWYDAQPGSHVKLVFRYTQARTTRTVLTRTIEINEPRKSPGSRKNSFVFNGAERAEAGDILSWRIELYVDGKLVDYRQSYLWE